MNFISKERVDENIQIGLAKPGEYKEVQVPLNTIVVEGSPPSEEAISTAQEQETQSSTPEQTTSEQDKEWVKAVQTTNTEASHDYGILLEAAASYNFDDIKRYCTDLRSIASDSLRTSKSYEVSPQYQASKDSYETAMQEFYDAMISAWDG